MRRDSLEVVGLPGQAVPAKKAPQLESCSVDGGGGVTLVNRYTDAELTGPSHILWPSMISLTHPGCTIFDWLIVSPLFVDFDSSLMQFLFS